jgi:hypothetical protein
MSNLSNTELREAIYEILVQQGLPLGFLDNPKRWQYFYNSMDEVMKLIQAAQQQLLTELMEQKINGFYTQSTTMGVEHVTSGAVPVAVMERYLTNKET